MNRLIFIFVQVNSTHNIQQHLTQLFLLFFNLCREFSGTGDSQRRLRLLYHICETLAWVDRKDKCQDDKWLKPTTINIVYNTEWLGVDLKKMNCHLVW